MQSLLLIKAILASFYFYSFPIIFYPNVLEIAKKKSKKVILFQKAVSSINVIQFKIFKQQISTLT